jgi:uncharacterized protein YyaL (SSP411 family)
MAEENDGLPARIKSVHDTPVPSGNSVALANLQKLYLLTEEKKYDDAAEEVVAAFSGAVRDNFFPCATFLRSLSCRWHSVTILLDGRPLDGFEDVLRSMHIPGALALRNAPPSLALAAGKRDAAPDKPVAMVCTGFSCQPPLYDGPALRRFLEEERRQRPKANDG